MERVLESLHKSDLLTLKKLLKERPALLAETDEQGASVLALALKEHCEDEILDYLVGQGASIQEIDDEGVNILEYALTYGNHRFIKYLLSEGVSPHVTQRRSGFTPLMAAVCYNHIDIVRLFIDEGVNIFAQDNSGLTAMDFARRMHRKKIFALLEEHLEKRV